MGIANGWRRRDQAAAESRCDGLKVLRGKPGRRPLNEDEPDPEVRLPKPPSHLSAVARREWRRAGELLVEMGLTTNLDVASLASYCVGFAHLTEATNALKRYGLMMKSPMQSRYLAVLN